MTRSGPPARARQPWWRSWQRFWMWLLVALMVAGLIGGVWLRPLALLAMLLPVAVGLLMGIGAIVAPEPFLRWRAADADERRHGRELLASFDRAFGTTPEPDGTYSRAAISHTRTLGAIVTGIVLLLGTGVTAAYLAGAWPPQ